MKKKLQFMTPVIGAIVGSAGAAHAASVTITGSGTVTNNRFTSDTAFTPGSQINVGDRVDISITYDLNNSSTFNQNIGAGDRTRSTAVDAVSSYKITINGQTIDYAGSGASNGIYDVATNLTIFDGAPDDLFQATVHAESLNTNNFVFIQTQLNLDPSTYDGDDLSNTNAIGLPITAGIEGSSFFLTEISGTDYSTVGNYQVTFDVDSFTVDGVSVREQLPNTISVPTPTAMASGMLLLPLLFRRKRDQQTK